MIEIGRLFFGKFLDPQEILLMNGREIPGRGAGNSSRAGGPIRRATLLRVITYGFVVSLFFESHTFPFLRVSDTVTRNLGILLIAAFAVLVVLKKRQVGLAGSDLKWFVTFIVIVTLEEIYRFLTLDSVQAEASWRHFFSYVQVLAMYFVFRSITRDPRALRGVLITYFLLLAGAATMTNLGIARVVVETAGGRVGVAGINLNQMAFLYAGLVVCVFSGFLGRWPRIGWRDLVLLAVGFPVVIALAKTASRGGAFALLLGLAITLFVRLKVKKLPAYLLVVPLLIAGVAFVAVSSPVMKNRIESTIVGGDTGGRGPINRGVIRMIEEKPLVGWGASYVADLGRIIGENGKRAAHNTYLQLLVSFGIFATAALLVGIFLTILGLWRRRSSVWEGTWFAVVTMMMGFGIVGHLGYNKHFWIFLALSPNIGLMAFALPRRLSFRSHRLGNGIRQPARVPSTAEATAYNRDTAKKQDAMGILGPLQPQAPTKIEQ